MTIPKRSRKRIGVFGGTFDPPHIGHLILAENAFHQLDLTRLLWVLTPDPPHKQHEKIHSLALRLEMVQAAIRDNSDFEISRADIDRPGPQYAVDTVRLVKTQNPEAEIIYLMGGDSLHDLPTWHTPDEFVRLVDGIGVMSRFEDNANLERLEMSLGGLTRKVIFLDVPLVEISASDVRQRAASGKPYRYFLPPLVYAIVRDSGAYLEFP